MSSKYIGACFCGAVEVEVAGSPELMGYCHCESCRQWSASPVNAFTLWKRDSFNIVKGEENLNSFKKTENTVRYWCTTCGGHVYGEHPTMGLIDVYAATIPTLQFTPAIHVHYAETVLPIKDGLPKMKDLPAEVGGSGEILSE